MASLFKTEDDRDNINFPQSNPNPLGDQFSLDLFSAQQQRTFQNQPSNFQDGLGNLNFGGNLTGNVFKKVVSIYCIEEKAFYREYFIRRFVFSR